MIVAQEIKYKNDYNGNPRSLVVLYSITPKEKFAHVLKVEDPGYTGVETLITQYEQQEKISIPRLPTLYNWESYTKAKQCLPHR